MREAVPYEMTRVPAALVMRMALKPAILIAWILGMRFANAVSCTARNLTLRRRPPPEGVPSTLAFLAAESFPPFEPILVFLAMVGLLPTAVYFLAETSRSKSS